MARVRIETPQLVVWANELRLPMDEIMRRSGMTRVGIWKRLKAAGAFIPRCAPEGAPGIWVTVPCAFCGTGVKRRKRLVLRTMKQFCTQNCYFASLEKPGYVHSRHGCRLARAIVHLHFALQPEHIVHHKDGDERNNDKANLAVYASQADHMAHHRGKHVKTVWDGAAS